MATKPLVDRDLSEKSRPPPLLAKYGRFEENQADQIGCPSHAQLPRVVELVNILPVATIIWSSLAETTRQHPRP